MGADEEEARPRVIEALARDLRPAGARAHEHAGEEEQRARQEQERRAMPARRHGVVTA
jgi:hypothetical protein